MKRILVLAITLGGCLSAYALDYRFWTNYQGAYQAYLHNKTKQTAKELWGAYQDIQKASTYPVKAIFPIRPEKKQEVAASWQQLSRKQVTELANREKRELESSAEAMLLARTYILNEFCPLIPQYQWLLRQIRNKLASVAGWDKNRSNATFDELYAKLQELLAKAAA